MDALNDASRPVPSGGAPTGWSRVGWVATRALTWSGIPERFGVVARRPDADELAVRGVVVVAAGIVLPFEPTIAVLGCAAAWRVPPLIECRRARAADDEVGAELGLAVELLAVSARAGATVPQAVGVVGDRVPGRVGRALRGAAARLRTARGVASTLDDLADELGPRAGALVAVLRSAYFDGEPLAPALERLAHRLAEDRRRQVHAEARRLSVQLLLPLVCCLLPAFALVAVAPVVLDSLRVLAH